MALEVTWKAIQSMGFPPSPREAHTMIALDASRILLLGGCCVSPGSGPQQFDDVFVFDLKEAKWSQIVSKGDRPRPRTGSSAIMLGDNCRVLMFGGSSMTEGYTNDLYILDTKKWVWSTVSAKGVPPSPRDKHTACLFENKVYVFGGFGPAVPENWVRSDVDDRPDDPEDQKIANADVISEDSTNLDDSTDEEEDDESCMSFTWFNDLHVLDIRTMEWKKIETTGLKPSPRAAHIALTAKLTNQNSMKDTMILFGGRDPIGRQNDLFYLDLQTLEWKKVCSKAPPPRSFHAMVSLGESQLAVCYGGVGVNGEMFPGLELLNLNTMEWKSLKSKSGIWPPLRGASAMTGSISKDVSQLIIFGGSCSLKDGETFYYNDVYSVDVSCLVNAAQ